MLLGFLAALLAFVTLLTGCSSASQGGTAASEGSQRVVKTEKGDVSIPVKPERVVLLNFALAGYLYDLGAPVKAMTPEFTDAKDPQFAEFWKADAEKAGTSFLPWGSSGFDLEAILAAKPDLIIAGGMGFPYAQASDVYQQLTDIAPTVMVNKKYTTWQEQLKFLATDVFGQPDLYQHHLDAYQKRKQEVKAAITLPPGPVSYLSITADAKPYVLMEDQGLPIELQELGFKPAPLYQQYKFEPYTKGGDMFKLSPEQITKYLTMPTVFVMGFNRDTFKLDELKAKSPYSKLPAVTANRMYQLPYWVVRGDYDESMALLDQLQKYFS
ncbi:ferric enterobactin (enterochelin)-binding protein [Psychromicrobium lacuslunae]|uniref:Ferric enterobactin (Enterochelin)-binding protein n=2 Tax=Psychromicrobium lacuslunae TaxID=1618207 RepID=A0A0D4C0K6_9MICC|nr:ferric enterobactin (enterochelin)-binding protein [Psychromicrobium lacuslunae]